MQSAKGLKSHSREKGEGAVRGKKTKNQNQKQKRQNKSKTTPSMNSEAAIMHVHTTGGCFCVPTYISNGLLTQVT